MDFLHVFMLGPVKNFNALELSEKFGLENALCDVEVDKDWPMSPKIVAVKQCFYKHSFYTTTHICSFVTYS